MLNLLVADDVGQIKGINFSPYPTLFYLELTVLMAFSCQNLPQSRHDSEGIGSSINLVFL